MPAPEIETCLPPPRLSPREVEVLAYLEKGFASKEIAARLGVAASTVKSHRKAIFGKTGVHSRAEAVAKARASHLPAAFDLLWQDLLRTPSAAVTQLSCREMQVLQLLTEGLSGKQIGARIGLSEGTVKGYRRTLFEKLGVHSRAAAIAKGRALGFAILRRR